MTHLRQTIRDDIVDLLKLKTAADDRVWAKQKRFKSGEGDLPAIQILIPGGETSSYAAEIDQHDINIQIIIAGRSEDEDVAIVLDDIDAIVEKELLNMVFTSAETLGIKSSGFVFDPQLKGAEDFAMLIHNFQLKYTTAPGEQTAI